MQGDLLDDLLLVGYPKDEGNEFIRHTLSAEDHQGEDAQDSDINQYQLHFNIFQIFDRNCNVLQL